jgi:hypothetical protein
MPETFVSRSPVILDVPDPPRPELQFVYNFFQPDEKTNDKGNASNPLNDTKFVALAKALKLHGYDSPTQEQTTTMKNFPRFMVISFDPVVSISSMTDPVDLEALDAVNAIQDEASITTIKYGTAMWQDNSLVTRIRENLKFTINMRVPPSQQTGGSPADYAKNLDILTFDQVESDMLLEAITDLFNEDPSVGASLSYVNEVGDQVQTNFLANQMSEQFNASIHENFRADILRSSVTIPFCPYKKSTLISEYSFINKSGQNYNAFGIYGLSQIQKQLRDESTPEIDQVADFSPTILAVDVTEKNPTGGEKASSNTEANNWHSNNNSATLVGYIVEKYEMLPNGQRIKGPSIFYNRTPGATAMPAVHVFDAKIKYGRSYAYAVRSVYRLIMQVLVPPSHPIISGGGTYILTAFVKSKPGPEAVMKCDEIVAPSPPDGLTFDYQYSIDALLIGWQMPGNSQADVKKYQVFKRLSIMHPFTLIAEYNFDDSVIPTPSTENVHPRNVHFVSWAQNGHIDRVFNRKSSAIYAVCAIDAHGFSSQYSGQFRVKFDRKNNKIKVNTVSQPGAPKQYPNFFVASLSANDWKGLFAETETFDIEDPNVAKTIRVTEHAMRDSNHRKMRVYFDPEYLRMESQTGEPVQRLIYSGLAEHENDPTYKIHIVNVDRQEGKSVTIQIRDKIGYTQN